MRVDGVRPAEPQPAERAAAGAPPREFATVLASALGAPKLQLAELREAIAAIRDGRAWQPGAAASAAVADDATFGWSATAARTSGGDPFGWRALTRTLGDRIVGPGFGELFERQIQQESGYDPAVVFGQRRSSASAEGIAQLMPQFYPHVRRADPEAALRAGAETMRHYLGALGGDLRKALAAYNSGLGHVQSLVRAHGAQWERALPAETKQYLAAILGDAAPRVRPGTAVDTAVFGGRGGGGVLVSPLRSVLAERGGGDALRLAAAAGAEVYAPADGVVAELRGDGAQRSLLLDHGGGWQTLLAGLDAASVAVGERVARSQPLGTLAEAGLPGQGLLELAVLAGGERRDPRPYLLRT
jgi:murein DD-endopeptidase MepM/ murein hydrolase activator NlpD